jgi:lysozyme family protein
MSSITCTGAPSSAPPPAYPAAFISAVGRVLQDEGGYVDDPLDPGGETKFGISKREYPDLDIRNLTREQAIAIYWHDYWRAYHLDEMRPEVAAKALNLAVLMGPHGAIVCVQRACRACGRPLADDGIAGRLTLDAAHTIAGQNVAALLAAIRSEAAGYFRTVSALERGRRPNRDEPFLKEWLRRAYE